MTDARDVSRIAARDAQVRRMFAVTEFEDFLRGALPLARFREAQAHLAGIRCDLASAFAGAAPPREATPDTVTRFEVIDHRHGAPRIGRAFVAWGCQIELSYQDDERTLKVFVTGDAEQPLPPPLTEPERAEVLAKMRANRLAGAPPGRNPPP